ncbi:ATP-binding protein [Saccharopolyspora indica]|uniref:sensor histidine kinase n=1 Tax=Saccharopolyspora indica TaxID=1229659 RepID=UPI0022EA9F95|nr:sensor histidine kinase [Saccharopolyspora indica]MDA3642846.1 ATP-binding protein [Saccharopolyspora indica]
MILAASLCLMVLLVLSVRLAHRAGYRHGRRCERDVLNRYLHDRVLPTLEAFALGSRSDEGAAPARLAELRQAAKEQAALIRRDMAAAPAAGRARLGPELVALIEDLSRSRLRAELIRAEVDDTLSAARRTAVRDATGEALRNTLKHSGTDQAEVRVAERDGGIAVTVRDRGAGFDPARKPGFGIAESIKARMTEVGGSARVESRPDWGTQVTLWVPQS